MCVCAQLPNVCMYVNLMLFGKICCFEIEIGHRIIFILGALSEKRWCRDLCNKTAFSIEISWELFILHPLGDLFVKSGKRQIQRLFLVLLETAERRPTRQRPDPVPSITNELHNEEELHQREVETAKLMQVSLRRGESDVLAARLLRAWKTLCSKPGLPPPLLLLLLRGVPAMSGEGRGEDVEGNGRKQETVEKIWIQNLRPSG